MVDLQTLEFETIFNKGSAKRVFVHVLPLGIKEKFTAHAGTFPACEPKKKARGKATITGLESSINKNYSGSIRCGDGALRAPHRPHVFATQNQRSMSTQCWHMPRCTRKHRGRWRVQITIA
ncbi:MAG: hypothetical protein WAM55_11030 [Methylovirgula sp.]